MMAFFIAVGVIVALALPCLPASIAKRKGKDYALWYIYGLFLWIIAVIHAISLPEPPQSQTLDLKPIQSSAATGDGNAPTAKKVDLDAPLQLLELDLSKGGENLFFQASFRSLDARKVMALKVRVTGYNAFKEPVMVGGAPELEFVLQDLVYNTASVLQMAKPLLYPAPEARTLQLAISQICFEDGEILQVTSHTWVEPAYQKMDYYTAKLVNDSLPLVRYWPEAGEQYWLCACGTANHKEHSQCRRCRADRDTVLELTSKENIQKLRSQRDAALKAQQEKDEADGKRFGQIVLIVLAIGTILTIAVVAFQILF